MRHDQAVALILAGSGSHFDPDVVRAFAEIADEFKAIASRYADKPDGFAKPELRLQIVESRAA
jgi:putative two-component system response regulator